MGHFRDVLPSQSQALKKLSQKQQSRQATTNRKNWMILVEQSFTACMPLLTMTSACVLERCYNSPRWCYLHHHCTLNKQKDTVTKNKH